MTQVWSFSFWQALRQLKRSQQVEVSLCAICLAQARKANERLEVVRRWRSTCNKQVSESVKTSFCFAAYKRDHMQARPQSRILCRRLGTPRACKHQPAFSGSKQRGAQECKRATQCLDAPATESNATADKQEPGQERGHAHGAASNAGCCGASAQQQELTSRQPSKRGPLS